MGLFDKILGGQSSENTTLTKQEAVASVILVTIAADGNISDEEKEGFVAISNRMKILRDQSANEFNQMIRKLQSYLQKHGSKWLLEKAVVALPRELRDTVFALAADLVFADGSIEDEEKAIIESLQTALKVPDDLAVKILEVVQIKNRG